MEEKDVKTGQRIVLTKEAELLRYDDKHPNFKAGMRGTIINKDYRFKDSCIVLIEFDEYINGHAGGKYAKIKGKGGHCWWLDKQILIKTAHISKRKNNY